MKLVLLIVAGAFATQDVTPPVISLSFSTDNRYASGDNSWRGICHAKDQSSYAQDYACQTKKTSSDCETGCTAVEAKDETLCAASTDCSESECAAKLCQWTSGNHPTSGVFGKVRPTSMGSSASVMCYVESDETSCPDPKCSATDHHDKNLQCDDPAVTMIQRNLASSLTKHAADDADSDYSSTAPKSWSTSPKDSTCVGDSNEVDASWTHRRSHKFVPSTAETPPIPDGDGKHFKGTDSRTCVPRSILGQYLVTYGARDASGNEAEKVSFSFLFVDPFVPDLLFDDATTHGAVGYEQRMLYWPNPASESLITCSDPTQCAGNAVYNTGKLQIVRPTTTDAKRNTWGAFYSAWSSCVDTATCGVAGDHDPFALAVDTFSGSSVNDDISGVSLSWTSKEERFNFGTSQAPKGFARKSNFEAGDCTGEFGGFLDAQDNGEEHIIKGDAGFCASKKSATPSYDTHFLKTSAGVDCSAKDEDDCSGQCEWVAGCNRTPSTTKAKWDYNLKVSADDNYRNSLTVYYKVAEDAAGTWKAGGATTSHIFCMRPGAPYIVDFIVSDEAGIFGFEHKDNMQTHRIQFTVTDNTRPVVKPVTNDIEATATATDVSTSAKDWMKCAELTHPSLCKGECTYDTDANACTAKTDVDDSDGAFACRSKTTNAGVCEGYTTKKKCWDENKKDATKGCVWTRTAKLARSSTCDGEDENSCDENTCKLYSFVDRSALTATQDAASVLQTGSEKYKCRSKQKQVTVGEDTTYKQTSSESGDTTIFLECGTEKHVPTTDQSFGNDKTNAAVKLRGSVKTLGKYEEHGFQAEDNWDNYDGGAGCAAHSTITCVPLTTTPSTSVWDNAAPSGSGHCQIDNTQLAHADSTDGGDHAKDDYSMATMFETDYLVSYMYTDSEDNNAWPVTRRVVVQDTTVPELHLRGDCTLENSAGAHTNSNPASTHASFKCIANTTLTLNRFVQECGTHTAQEDCEDDNNCVWHQNSADKLNADGSINLDPQANDIDGLFDHGRIAKFFDHRDDCDRHVVTIVTLHEGACDRTDKDTPGINGGAATCAGRAPKGSCTIGGVDVTDDVRCTKIDCTDGDKSKCALDIFRWKGQEVHDQTHEGESIFAGGNYAQKFPEWEAGTYAVQYQTIDASGLKVTGCREIKNVDHTHPIIQILGSDQMTLEATHQGNYIDDGATCSDQVDGVISQNVEVSGDVVNLSKVGTYTITYNCKDSANNEAPAAQRTVVVAQTSCPKCTMYGKHSEKSGDAQYHLTHEASFPYVDAGATCSDVIDGSVTVLCESSKDPGSESSTNCETPTNLVDVGTTGTYIITYRAMNTVGLYNDGASCRGGPTVYKRTVEVKDTLRPVITLRYGTTGTDSDPKVAQGSINEESSVTKDYDTIADASPYKSKWQDEHDARYSVGGTEAEIAAERRNFRDYPASETGSSKHPATLMAEQTTSSVNGWVIGAFASAVAGLALLGYSTRRTTVATSVPV